MFKYWMVGAATAAMCSTASLAASAAPASNSGYVGSAAQHETVVEKAAHRRCWWREGRRYCRLVERRDYGVDLYVGRPRPEAFPTGSTAWWRAMDYEGRGGHGRTP